MDFYKIRERSSKRGTIEIYPDFIVCQSKDLMVRGKSFYAIWDEEKGLWSTDEYDVPRLVDKELLAYRDEVIKKTDESVHVKLMSEFSTRSWLDYRNYLGHLADSSRQLDTHLTFQNTEVKKKDYVSKRLPYSLEEGKCEAYDEIIGTLYDPEERAKLEWSIGAIVAGDAKDIQKFIVLYGEAGAGKSTMLNIIQKLFEGYYTTFEAKALTSSSNSFSTEVFRSNPLVAIQHDGDLSKIEDNTKLNSIISHEEMTMNEKYKPSYTARLNCFLFMATNKPVKITDAKSGIIRRLIDVRTSGRKIPTKKYHDLMSRIQFELGAIAFKCLTVYKEMGKNYYSNYRPLDMILQTDVFFNFVESKMDLFLEQKGISLSQAYEMYKVYCDEALVDFKLPRHKFREELKNYFKDFFEITRVDGKQVRSYYSGLLLSKFTSEKNIEKEDHPSWLYLERIESVLDKIGADYPAQYASEEGIPLQKWKDVKTTLSDLDTTKLHYVIFPENHIVIDFDIKDDNGEKSSQKNLEAASKWPPTYAEFSKSESGIHLHYIYEGDSSKLSSLFDKDIEIKVCRKGDVGYSSIRRKLSLCNSLQISTIKDGLPQKGEKMINFEGVKSEKSLRELIKRNLRKEIHPATKPSIDFIYKILEDAYFSDLKYDVTDMRQAILVFAMNSTHQADYCVSLVNKMKFQSEEPSENVEAYSSDELVFFDVEVFPNLFVVVWKYAGKDNKCVKMINPTASEIEQLLRLKLVGFNCRRYDNHILYGRYIGYTNEELYRTSQKIVGENRTAFFSEAYNLSYADVYDFSSKKQSLKKFQIDLGIHHQELGLPWNEPVSEEDWERVADYCANDVISLEKIFEDRKEDYTARLILSELSGLSVNDTTQNHTARIIFGKDSKPQEKFIYTDLSDLFPGYSYEFGKSFYKGEEPGEGGYVYAEPGYYEDVVLLDVASMHPTSIELLNLFGPYTSKFSELKSARLAIKHKDYESAKKMLGGRLAPYLTSIEQAEALSYALKIVINIVYGLTSASFENKFRDKRNVDNIVAKRGALFMIDLKFAVQERGFTVAHIKTDSIKIPKATKEIIDFVIDFGKKYGYTFEQEGIYDRFLLVNDAVYIARYKDGKNKGKWISVGAQFSHPYLFKTLFSKEPILFEDMCETKSVSSSIYLDMNEDLGDSHNYKFIGKVGSFCPIKKGCGGGILLREKDGKYYAVTGSKGYRWLEAELVKELKKEKDIDINYYRSIVDEAISDISKFINIEEFVS